MAHISSTPLKQAQLQGPWDAIVIGSGMGGLTAAALLSVHGQKRVLVLERHYVAGGYTHSFSRPGFSWDVGVHYIGQVANPTDPVRRAFDHLTAGRLQWEPMPEVYDRVAMGGMSFDFVRGKERLKAALKTRFPQEARVIDRYFKAVQAANRAAALYYVEKSIPAPVARVMGRLLRARCLHWARQTTSQVLRKLGATPELAGLLTAQWGDYGLTPAESSFAIHATIVEHYLEGASYPVGGAEQIAATILPQIERAGGMVVTSAEVAQIMVQNGMATGVELAGGQRIDAPLVISDAGAINTFFRLLPAQLPDDRPELASLREKLRGFAPSMAHLNLFVGFDGSSQELGLSGTQLWVYPSHDHDAEKQRFVDDPSLAFPAIFISFPSAKDPAFEQRHPGHATAEMVAPVPYSFFERWAGTHWMKRGAEYEAFKQQWTERLTAELLHHFPQLKGRIAHVELSTPLSTQHFMNFQYGEVYGIPATPERYLLRELGARTPIAGLLLTGADVAGAGVTGALYGGAITAGLALKRNLMGVLHKPLPSQSEPS
jgi:all-trans-retinol 13,14-reductase